MMCSRTCADVLLDELGVVVHLPDLQRGEARRHARERRVHALGDRGGVGADLLLDRERDRVGAVRGASSTSAPRSRPRRGRRRGRGRSSRRPTAGSRSRSLPAVSNSPLVRSEMLWPWRVIRPPGRSRFSAASLSATTLTGRPSASRRPRVEVDLDLADVAAVDLDGRHAVDLLEQRLEVVFDLAARHVGALRRADRERHDRQRRRRRSGRSSDPRSPSGSRSRIAATFSRTSAAAFCASTSRRSSTPTRANRFGRARLDALDAVDAGDGILDRLGDERLDFFGRRARVDDDDVHERKADVREQVDAEPRHRHDAEHHEAHDEHRREDGPADGDVGNPHIDALRR